MAAGGRLWDLAPLVDRVQGEPAGVTTGELARRSSDALRTNDLAPSFAPDNDWSSERHTSARSGM